MKSSHVAYADESYYTGERFRSIAVVTFENSNKGTFSKLFRSLLEESNVTEFKWNKLRQARERFAAIKLIDKSIELAISNQLRVDVVIWDTHDSRHQVEGRDDIANLQRMYYHLFRNVLLKRWPSNSTWYLFPDENSALDWVAVQDYLDTAGLTLEVTPNLFEKRPFHIRLSRDFKIHSINEVSSASETVGQVADLFAGIGAYSHSAFVKYNKWLSNLGGQLSMELFPNENLRLSNSEKERFAVMKHLDDTCKDCKLRVSLKSAKGFKTFDPNFPINFWPYEPQHSDDKAPTK
jgi:hypothetical protein